MSKYNQLHNQVTVILKKYSLGNIIQDIEVDFIHELVRKHAETLKACNTFEKGKLMANQMLIAATAFPLRIEAFVTSVDDQKALYQILVSWRDSIL